MKDLISECIKNRLTLYLASQEVRRRLEWVANERHRLKEIEGDIDAERINNYLELISRVKLAEKELAEIEIKIAADEAEILVFFKDFPQIKRITDKESGKIIDVRDGHLWVNEL